MDSQLVIKNWLWLLVPAFICTATAQCTLTLPSIPIGIVAAFWIARLALYIEDLRERRLAIIGLSVLASFITALFSILSYGGFPFGGADINNPYLTDTQNFWR